MHMAWLKIVSFGNDEKIQDNCWPVCDELANLQYYCMTHNMYMHDHGLLSDKAIKVSRPFHLTIAVFITLPSLSLRFLRPEKAERSPNLLLWSLMTNLDDGLLTSLLLLLPLRRLLSSINALVGALTLSGLTRRSLEGFEVSGRLRGRNFFGPAPAATCTDDSCSKSITKVSQPDFFTTSWTKNSLLNI